MHPALVVLLILTLIFFILGLILIVRLILTLPAIRPRSPSKRSRDQRTQVLVVLGSGGHTAEMMMLLNELETSSYTNRKYVVSSGDAFSAQKAVELEQRLFALAEKSGYQYGEYSVETVPRARKIHQPLFTTPISSLYCLLSCANILRRDVPDLIVSNGPATGTIMIFAATLLRALGVGTTKMRIIYVESWARVKRLSLSGRLLAASGACDRFLVQWQTLARDKTPSRKRREFRGPLVG